MSALTTCLWFDNQAEDAARFYVDLFTDARLGTVTRYGDAGPGEPGTAMTVEFEIGGQNFVGLNGGPAHTFNEAVSLQIPCADQAEVDRYWEKLSDGGREGRCAWVQDRFGLWWQVVPTELSALLGDPDPARAKRAMEAMFTMSKIDIEAIRRAADDA